MTPPIEAKRGVFLFSHWPPNKSGNASCLGGGARCRRTEARALSIPTRRRLRGAMLRWSAVCSPPSPPPPGLDRWPPSWHEGRVPWGRLEAPFQGESTPPSPLHLEGVSGPLPSHRPLHQRTPSPLPPLPPLGPSHPLLLLYAPRCRVRGGTRSGTALRPGLGLKGAPGVEGIASRSCLGSLPLSEPSNLAVKPGFF